MGTQPLDRIPRKLRIVSGVFLTALWTGGTGGVVLTFLSSGSSTSWSYRLKAIGNHLALPRTFDPRDGVDWIYLVFSISMNWSLFTWAVAVLIAFVLVVVLLVAFVAAIGAGMPLLKVALYCRVTVEPIPIGSRQLVLVDVSSRASTHLLRDELRHSALYNSPDAIRAVILALEGFATRANAPCDDGQGFSQALA